MYLIFIRYNASLNPIGCIPLVALVFLLVILGNLGSVVFFFFLFFFSLPSWFLLRGDLDLSSFSSSVSPSGSLSLSSITCSLSPWKLFVFSRYLLPRSSIQFLPLRIRFWIYTDPLGLPLTVNLSLISMCYALFVSGILLFPRLIPYPFYT